MRTQLNVQVPAKLAKRAKLEALNLSATLGGLAEVALEQFLSKPVACRRTALETHRKKTGRNINAK